MEQQPFDNAATKLPHEGFRPEDLGRIIVVMPAYNAERTLKRTVDDLPKDLIHEVILVDDASMDQTVALAESLGLTVITHAKNQGYGANIKKCFNEALQRFPDVVVELHPDYQYDPRVIPFSAGFLKLGTCDVVLGNRIRTRREAIEGGMPIYKYISNRFLTSVENLVLGQNISDAHTGFRAYRREVLEAIPFHRNSDDFNFATQILTQCVYFGFKIGEVPMPVRYFDEASSINFSRSAVYGLRTLQTLGQYLFHRLGIMRSPLFLSDS
jgi:glycosyltransferase involved in cell wall biosynthesis